MVLGKGFTAAQFPLCEMFLSFRLPLPTLSVNLWTDRGDVSVLCLNWENLSLAGRCQITPEVSSIFAISGKPSTQLRGLHTLTQADPFETAAEETLPFLWMKSLKLWLSAHEPASLQRHSARHWQGVNLPLLPKRQICQGDRIYLPAWKEAGTANGANISPSPTWFHAHLRAVLHL